MELSAHRPAAFTTEVCIVGTGSITAVGCNTPMTAASVRANISRFSESALIDKTGEPMVLALATFIEDHLRGLERLLAMAIPAAKEAMAPLLQDDSSPMRPAPLPICLGIAAPRPGFDANIEHLILQRLESETALPFSKSERVVIPTGHAAGLMGLERAIQQIGVGAEDVMLVGGVDSYYDWDTLEWLDQQKRLSSEENIDGFIPGEGAGFCLVASLDFAQRYHIRPLAMISSAVSGEEPHPLTSDGICIGTGLTGVLHRVLAGLQDGVVADWTMCDLNGESFRANEWMYAYLRTAPKHGDPLEIWHPADCYGDIGAASGLVLTGIGIASWERKYARGAQCVIWTASDGKQRSAVLLKNPT